MTIRGAKAIEVSVSPSQLLLVDLGLLLDPPLRELRPDRRLAGADRQAKAVRAMREDMYGMRDAMSGKRSRQPIGVFDRDVRVLGCVPDEERR